MADRAERESTQSLTDELSQLPDYIASPLAAPSATTTFARDHKTYRSIGTHFSPETAAEEAQKAKVVEEPVELKEDAFKALPRETVVRVLEWVFELQVAGSRKALEESDSRRTGWLSTDRMRYLYVAHAVGEGTS